ncbi:MAG: efflux RND transporter periplasmic adaptor subunit [Gammaproteobacteria bacterium]
MSARVITLPLVSWLALALAACGDGPADTPDQSADVEQASDSPSDHTTIANETAGQIGIRTAPVMPGVIHDAHEVQGLLTPVEGRHARIRARFPGPVQRVQVGVGDNVKAGQTLAVIESNVSLSAYDVTAPFGGTILDVAVGMGDLAGDQALFELADLSSLWVDMHLFGSDAQHIAPGLGVQITRLSDGAQASTKLDRILPGAATASQSTVARATILNSDGQWRPGAAVRARVTVSEREAAVVVPATALQTMENAPVVFTRSGDTYTVRHVRIGERDSVNVEILEGLSAGEDVVVEQSYLIKADLEKASAADED